MGNAAIWYAPNPETGVLRKISLPARLSDLQFHNMRDVDIAQAMGGRFDEQHLRGQPRATVTVARFRNSAQRNELLALENHLDRGGSCIVAEDDERAWAAFVAPPDAGETEMQVESTPWVEIHNGAPTGEMVLQGPSPELLEERSALANFAPLLQVATLETAARFDWRSRRWVLLRCEGFLPQMVRAKEERNTPGLQHEHRINYEFRLTLDMDVDRIDELATADGIVLQGESDVGGFGHDGDSLLLDESGGQLGPGGAGGRRSEFLI